MKISPLLLLAALIGIGVGWGASLPALSAYDDAYITYRYAANLARGAGLLYNPGEWVLGTTTPLYALLLTPFAGFGLSAVVAAGHWIAVACWIATAWLAAALLWRAGYALGAAAAALFVMAQPVMLASLGMETALVTALMLFTAWSWLGSGLGGRRGLAVASAVALLLTRQDAALWLLFVGLATWTARAVNLPGSFKLPGRLLRTFPWREATATLLLTLGWLLFAAWRYGAILPNSAAAKIGQRAAMQVTGEAPFLAALPAAISGPRPEWTAWGLFALAGIGAVAALWRARRFWYVPLWLAAYLAVFHALGVVNFIWYYGPPTTALALLAGLGIAWIAGEIGDKPPSRKPGTLWMASGKVSAALALVAALTLLPAMLDVARTRNSYNLTGKPAEYAAAGRWLAANASPDATVAAIEIGIVGYWSQRPILDLMGLVSPPMRERLTGWTDTVVYGVTTFWPEYALTLPGTAWDAVSAQEWFRAAYRPVQSFGSVTLYERVVDPPVYVPLADWASFAGIALGEVAFDRCGPECAFPVEIRAGSALSGWLALYALYGLPVQETSHQLTLFLVDAATQERHSVTTFWPYDDYNLYPTSRWPRDLIGTKRSFRQNVPFRIELPAELPPGAYRLGLIVYDEARGEALPVDAATGEDTAQFGWLRVGSPSAADIGDDARLVDMNAAWREGIALDALLLPRTPLRGGERMTVTLLLRALHTPSRDLTIFVHLLDGADALVAQADGRPFAGRFPTTVWQPNEELRDQVEIALPPDLMPGDYALRVGFYDAEGRALLTDGEDSLLLPAALRVEGQ